MKRPNAFELVLIKSALIFPILCLAFNVSGENPQKAWMVYAQSYIEAGRRIAENRPTILEDLKHGEKIAKQFHESEPPTIQEIEALLNSHSIEEQLVACVAVLLGGDYSIPIVEKLISNLQNQMPYDLVKTYELKRYSTLALKRVHQEDLKPYEDAILEAIEQESNEPALIEEMLFLLKLTPSKSARVLTNLLIYRDSDSVKRVAFGLIHKLGPEYKQRALEEVKKQGDHKTLELINKMDQPVQ